MSLIVVGTNHKYSPIEIREKLSFSKKTLRGALVSLISYRDIKGGVIISTCNRVELYASSSDVEVGIKTLKDLLSAWRNQELSSIEPYLYTYIGKEAIQHLFQVACGLDSQIIGEGQILEQVRFAYEQARAIEATDRLLDLIFQRAIKTSLKVKQDTGISRGDISVASIALELVKEKCGSIRDKNILIIGVSKISELVVRCLKKEEAKTVFVANRTFEKTQLLADCINAEVIRFERLKERLQDVDIIISATASPHLILKKEDVLDTEKPLLIIDLAVPRDIDPRIKDIKGISLFDLDDLSFTIEKELDKRKQEIPNVLKIIKEEVENLCLTEHLELALEPALLP